MSMTGNEDQDLPDTTEEENNDSRQQQPEPDLKKKNAPAPRTTTVPRIKPT